jgi:hypothetical protein
MRKKARKGYPVYSLNGRYYWFPEKRRSTG